MANFANSCLVTDEKGNSVIISVTMAFCDGIKGCYWTLHKEDGSIINYGISKGFDGSGLGSSISAMKLGKKAAKRYLKRINK